MKTKSISIIMCLLLVCFCLCGCGGNDAAASKKEKLYVYNWGEYIDDEVIKQFEEETGIDVIYDMFETNEIMYAKLAQDDFAGEGVIIKKGKKVFHRASV